MSRDNDLGFKNGSDVGSVKSDIAKQEEAMLAFWQERKIFTKSLEQTKGGEQYVFYDGPPFATGTPHYGHILAGTIKDAIPRYQTMKGRFVHRRWGWDCHGLPLENIVEKELGLSHKKEIEEYGIKKFNEQAKKSVLRYVKDWREQVPRFGRFVDMENDYRTMDASYTETVWWIFKNLYDKGLIYRGFKSMQLCPRCETTLSNFEVNQGYQDITDISVYVKFEILNPEKLNLPTKTSLIAWTTTPWTLPGNVALAVGPEIEYSLVSTSDENLLIATERFNFLREKIFPNYQLSDQKFKGADLAGLQYKPIFTYYSQDEKLANRENGWQVWLADFVTTEDGTGIVHIAPAFGEDDLELGRKYNLPFIQHVAITGEFKPEVSDFAGQMVKPKDDHQKTDIEIIKWLAQKGVLLAKEKIIHSYPHCWRCSTPLLNYAASSWFVRVTEFRDKLISANQKIQWVPEHLRDGRFGRWLEGARDWAISRTRFWGAPLPVWQCSACGEEKAFGSLSELQDILPQANNQIVLMRHGEAESNLTDIISSIPEAPHHLTEKGKSEVRATAERLKSENFDLIIASDFVRTKETAELVAEVCGIDQSKINFDPRLRELKMGEFDGQTWTDYLQRFKDRADRFNFEPMGGESMASLRRRIGDFLFDLETKYKGKKILLISHGLSLFFLKTVATGRSNREIFTEANWGSSFPTAGTQNLEFKTFPHNDDYELDFHRPYIDEINPSCSCGGSFRRVVDVFDCWFESGSMPYGQEHYPFANLEKFDPKRGLGYPAEFIAEGLDQTRGWFYSMLVLGVALFGESPYRRVITNGLILAEDGQKMSKSLKNYPDPMELVDKFGADAMRFYLLSSPVVRAEDLNFSEKGVAEISRQIVAKMGNVLSFWEMYADRSVLPRTDSENILDQWGLALLANTNKKVSLALDSYELDRATRALADFLDELSNWYLRRSRDRFKSESESERKLVAGILRKLLLEGAKLFAPFTPFLAETVYQSVRQNSDPESVHLASWPELPIDNEQEALLVSMNKIRQIVTLGLEARAKSGIKVRQPLNVLFVKDSIWPKNLALIELIKDELNVKKIEIDNIKDEEVIFDFTITPELKAEGQYREIVRALQGLRKDSGLRPGQAVAFNYFANEAGEKLLAEYRDQLLVSVSALDFKKQAEIKGLSLKMDEAEFQFSLG